MNRQRSARVHHSAMLVRFAVAVFLLVTPSTARLAAAQDRPRPVAEFAAGWVGFADDGIVSEGLVGGAVRWYLSSRLSAGPESVFIKGDSHSHLVVTGNLTWDLLAPSNGRLLPVTPFVVVGAGLFQTRETFASGTFTSSEGAFTAGGGVRSAVGDRVTVGIEARVGWETHVRVTGLLGVGLGP